MVGWYGGVISGGGIPGGMGAVVGFCKKAWMRWSMIWSAWEGVNEDKEQNTGTFYLGGVGASKLYPNGNNGDPVEISTVATCGSVSGSLAAISLAPAK